MPKTEEKRKERPKPAPRKKNESLQLLRNVAKSMAGAVPLVNDETRSTIEDSLARPLSGLASQYMGYNEETGEVENAAMANLRRIFNADRRRKEGLPPEKRVLPGMITDALSLPNILGNGPEWSQRMQELADATHRGVDEGMGLESPQGFRQNALNSLGVMTGQIPVPGREKAQAAQQAGQGALSLMKRMGKGTLTSPIEFMSPTIDPKMSNYLFGAVGGGALGSLGDEVPLDEMEEPRVPIHRAQGGKVGILHRLNKMARRRGERILDEDPRLEYMLGDDAFLDLSTSKDPIIMLSPEEFLGVASRGEPRNLEKRAKKLVKAIERDGLEDPPQLGYSYFDSGDGPKIGITRHNGRGRATALGELEIDSIPVKTSYEDIYDLPRVGGLSKKYLAHELPPGKLIDANSGRLSKARLLNLLKEIYPEDRFLLGYDGDGSVKLRREAFAEGGKVGALQAFLKMISMNPDARVKQTAHQIGDPVEEVLYATNEGQRKGVLSTVEAQQIKELLATGQEEELSEALMALHARLNPQKVGPPMMQNSPAPHRPPPQGTGGGDYREPVHGHGDWNPDDFARDVFKISPKARGGRISRR